MLEGIKKMFQKRSLAALEEKVKEINALESAMAALSDPELTAKSLALRERVRTAGEAVDAIDAALDEIAAEAFALVREAAKRTLGQRPFDVQLLGGLVLHRGAVAEMMTGEGKTLAGVAPAYLNALSGNGVHVVTVNEYLSRRDAVWMGKIYRLLGITVGSIIPGAAFVYDPAWEIPKADEATEEKKVEITGSFLVQQEFLRPVSRREAYAADITYGTNHEFGFDYLRDNLIYRVQDRVQRGHNFAIIDEVDSILIDEARTPLIIAAPDAQSSDFYKAFARIATNLEKDADYEVDEKKRTITISDAGVEKVEKLIGVQNIYAPENIRLVHYMEESIKAKALFTRDKDYVVKDNEVYIVDEFTGRLLVGRRYQAGLHQAIEAKEGVNVQQESRTYAKVSIQNYFRMYKKIAGMTGTAQTSAEEFFKVYKLEVESIPPNRGLARKDLNDLIYKNFTAKVNAIATDVRERQKKGQPVLLGTTSIARNELISAALSQAGIKHEVLNAKNNEREGAIIAQAGHSGAVTVATNVAGRGVDILLGGNPPDAAEAEKVRALGGLHVIGTDRHEARRIDNQLRGRAGRQGDPGSSQFFLSLDDDLLRIFGGDRIKGLMERFDLPENEPIEFGMVTKAVEQAQEKVEGANFDMRKHLIEYDDVLNRQRSAVYKRRMEFLELPDVAAITNVIADAAIAHFNAAIAPTLGQLVAYGHDDEPTAEEAARKAFKEAGIVADIEASTALETADDFIQAIRAKSAAVAEHALAKNQLLGILDMLWMTNLEDLEALQESVGLRAYAQRDPLVEYRHEASILFKSFWGNFNGWIFNNMFKLVPQSGGANGGGAAGAGILVSGNVGSAGGVAQFGLNIPAIVGGPTPASEMGPGPKIGRNDLCPCGSKKKWKHCGLLNTEEHQMNMAQSGAKHEVTGG